MDWARTAIEGAIVLGGIGAMWGDLRSQVGSLKSWRKAHIKDTERQDAMISELRIMVAEDRQARIDNQSLLTEINSKLDRMVR